MIVVLLGIALGASMAPAAQEASPMGRWHTGKAGGIVEIAPCGTKLCGRVVDGAPLRADPDKRDVKNSDPGLRSRRVLGLRVLEGFDGGPSEWKGGPLYDPETGQRAPSGTLKLIDRDTLSVKGCLVAFLCKTQRWTRVR